MKVKIRRVAPVLYVFVFLCILMSIIVMLYVLIFTYFYTYNIFCLFTSVSDVVRVLGEHKNSCKTRVRSNRETGEGVRWLK